MSELRIITNNVPRELIYWHELSSKERDELKDGYELVEDSSFFRYRGQVHDLSDFMRVEHNDKLKEWDAYSSDSFFSGTLVKILDSGDTVIVGRYIS